MEEEDDINCLVDVDEIDCGVGPVVTDNFDDKTVPLNPLCAVCGVDLIIVKQEVEEGEEEPGKWSEDEKSIYEWLVKWVSRRKRKGRVNLGWGDDVIGGGGDGGGAKGPFPFCGDCKDHLFEILEVQRKVDELQWIIKEGMDKLKDKANFSEGAFRKNGIYEKDGRYLNFRMQFVTDFKLQNQNLYPEVNLTQKRKKKVGRGKKRKTINKRGKASESKLGPSTNKKLIDKSSKKLPLVMLSVSDKLNAEKHLINTDIKEEEGISTEDNHEVPEDPQSIFLEEIDLVNDAVPDHSQISKRPRRRIRKRKEPVLEEPPLSPPMSPPPFDDLFIEDNNSDLGDLQDPQTTSLEEILPLVNEVPSPQGPESSNKDIISEEKTEVKASPPTSTRPRRSCTRKRKKPYLEEPPSSPEAPPFEGDPVEDHAIEDCDTDYDPSTSPPPPKAAKKRGKPSKPKARVPPDSSSGTRKKVAKKPEDEDWTAPVPPDYSDNLDLVDLLTDTSSDSSSDDDDIDDESGKRKRNSPVIDLPNKTITYKNLPFNLLDPIDPSSASQKAECSKCGSILKTNGSNLRAHLLRMHTTRFHCKACQYRGDNRASLKKHILKVHEGRQFPGVPKVPCQYCGKPTSKHHVKIHEWSHKSREEKRIAMETRAPDVPPIQYVRHQCDICGHSFPAPKLLQRHKDNVHASKEAKESKLELCSECGGTYHNLKTHLKMKHGYGGNAKVYTCLEDNCGKTFNALSHMAKHKDAVHRKIRPFKCSVCPREFSHRNSFIHHMNGHNGIRPFKCDHCPMAFTRKSNWSRHQGIYHTEGRTPKRKQFSRGPTMLASDVKKKDLQSEGKYLPPSALASWAAGREPTSHFVLTGAIKNNLDDASNGVS